MNIDVIIATRGRADLARVLLDKLRRQARVPDNVIVVGTEPADLPNDPPDQGRSTTHELISSRPGLTSQRNCGVAGAKKMSTPEAWRTKIIVFFDDDFRPEEHWLQRCEALFAENPEVVAITGLVLLDGARAGIAISEDEAAAAMARHVVGDQIYLSRWKRGLYGCNMAVRASVFDTCAFDENLPLYGWLEDADFSGQIQKFADTHRASNLVGVHLSSKSARMSGFKYGYSQICNPLYLRHKKTITFARAMYCCALALASNGVRCFREHPLIDYRGRLAGNLSAFADLVGGSMHPTKILAPHR